MKTGNVISLFARRPEPVQIEKNEPLNKKTSGQISLPFAASHTLFLVMATDLNHAETFLRFVTSLRVAEVLDMRVAPRLDFVAQTRQQAFLVFERLGLNYRDMLGRAEIDNYEGGPEYFDPLWAAVVSTLAPVPVTHAPILLIFDNLSFLHLARNVLADSYEVKVVDGKQVEYFAADELLRM